MIRWCCVVERLSSHARPLSLSRLHIWCGLGRLKSTRRRRRLMCMTKARFASVLGHWTPKRSQGDERARKLFPSLLHV